MPQDRTMNITKAYIERFGQTDDRPGYTCIVAGGQAEVPHNDRCRVRIAELLKQSDEGRERLDRYRRRKRLRQEAPSTEKSTAESRIR